MSQPKSIQSMLISFQCNRLYLRRPEVGEGSPSSFASVPSHSRIPLHIGHKPDSRCYPAASSATKIGGSNQTTIHVTWLLHHEAWIVGCPVIPRILAALGAAQVMKHPSGISRGRKPLTKLLHLSLLLRSDITKRKPVCRLFSVANRNRFGEDSYPDASLPQNRRTSACSMGPT
jgi:hypothetical protein